MINNAKKRIKRDNQIEIIQLLQRRGASSRKRIAEELQLTPASISKLTTEMLQAGLISDLGAKAGHKSTSGPREILLDLNETFKYLLGIDIEIDGVSIGLVTIKGQPQIKRSFKFDLRVVAADSFQRLVKEIVRTVKGILRKANLTATDILYGGIGMVGREHYYQTLGQEVPPLLTMKSNLVAELETKLAIPFCLENNVRALAMAESVFCYQPKHPSFLYFKIGPGMGSAIVLKNKLYRGENGQAGEIGSSVINRYYENDALPLGDIHLEDIISADFTRLELKNNWHAVGTPALYHRVNGDLAAITQKDIFYALHQGDPTIVALYRKKMHILASRIFDYTNLLDLATTYAYFPPETPAVLFTMLQAELSPYFQRLDRTLEVSHIGSKQGFLGGAGVAYIQAIKHLKNDDLELSAFFGSDD